jgi:hypothetical protein
MLNRNIHFITPEDCPELMFDASKFAPPPDSSGHREFLDAHYMEK